MYALGNDTQNENMRKQVSRMLHNGLIHSEQVMQLHSLLAWECMNDLILHIATRLVGLSVTELENMTFGQHQDRFGHLGATLHLYAYDLSKFSLVILDAIHTPAMSVMKAVQYACATPFLFPSQHSPEMGWLVNSCIDSRVPDIYQHISVSDSDYVYIVRSGKPIPTMSLADKYNDVTDVMNMFTQAKITVPFAFMAIQTMIGASAFVGHIAGMIGHSGGLSETGFEYVFALDTDCPRSALVQDGWCATMHRFYQNQANVSVAIMNGFRCARVCLTRQCTPVDDNTTNETTPSVRMPKRKKKRSSKRKPVSVVLHA